MAAERSARDIERDIEHARVSLAGAVDQITERTNPKRVTDTAKAAVLGWAGTPRGKAIIAGSGAVLAVLIIRRITRH